MKKIFFLLLTLFIVGGCNANGQSAEDEFNEYNNEDRIALFEKSEKISGMGATLIEKYSEPEKAQIYVNEEILPLLKDVKSQAENVDQKLETNEVQELHQLFLDQVTTLTDMFELQSDMLELQVPPVSEEDQQKTEELYPELQQLSDEVDQIGQNYSEKRKQLEEKYESS
ncbi:hypothetical protein GLW07_20230 [Bacillus hwajinpoensis]|uniref:Lipoprotein n=1 Tax=Guptibacillus hwajinpoensis TaxID=208199 RepID=A0A845F3R7_9BACL|nr:membrane lipoprotein lipid attachment site-containing protein [Pseudalkalibacillus hwajinpoensis]MYL65692.1 hypothetical protein [Pseudalkalibacillus hwajinpoensis]